MADFFSLDLGETLIRVADVRRHGNQFQADTMGLLEMDPLFFRTESDQLIEKKAAELTKLLDQLQLKKKDVRVVVPDSHSYNQFLEMPKLNEKELISAIRYQADQFIPMPLDDVNLDIEIIYEDTKNKKMLTLLSAAPKALIEKVSKLLEYAGLFPDSIEPQTSAVARFTSEALKRGANPKQQSQTGGIMLINMEFSSTSVYFFDLGLGLLTYSHNFPLGISLFLKEIQVNLNVDQKKAAEFLSSFGLSQNASFHLENVLTPGIKDFITEVDRSIKEINAKNGLKSLSSIFLFNEILKFHSFETLVGKYFGVPAQIFDISPFLVQNQITEFFKPNLAYFVASIGAALR